MLNLYEKIKEQNTIEKEKKQQDEENISMITYIDINLLDEFHSHIFSKLPDSKYQELKESIKRNGVLSPIIVRKKSDNRFEIISGHNRVRCCKELAINEIPCIIKLYDDNVAELVMIETNLTQREDILLCEKGRAYKRQLELLKKLRKENADNSSITNESNNYAHNEYVSSIEELSQSSDESRATIQRFIRLTELVPGLQEKVNNKIIPVLAGVEISNISKLEQEALDKYITDTNIQITVPIAKKLREWETPLTENVIDDIVNGRVGKIKVEKFTGKIKKDVLKKYRDKFKNDSAFSKLIDELLTQYFNSN